MTLSEENRLRVFENRVLRNIFGPDRNSTRLKKIRNIMIPRFTKYISGDKMKEYEMGWACGT